MVLSLGKIYVSAPTHVAVDNFAERIQRVDNETVATLNKDKGAEDETRARRKVVIRGYRLDDEAAAVRNLLERADLGSDASPFGYWRAVSKWKLDRSLAYWLLMVLGSRAVRPMDDDDSHALHEFRASIDDPASKDLRTLRDAATGKMSWRECKEDYACTNLRLSEIFTQLIQCADIVCSTPALSDKKPFWNWKFSKARGIAVDEAANMSRPDLCSVWGNTLLPCLLGGDDKQLQPAVMTATQADENGNLYQRHHGDGLISPLL